MSFWDNKKVLVTGGGGFVGSHLVEEVLRAGREVQVTVADRFSPISERNLAGVAGRVRMEKADLSSAEDCARVCSGQDVVLNLAARVGGVGFNAGHQATIFRDNIRISTFMLEAAQNAGVERFLAVSSACVYNRDCSVPTPESQGFNGLPEATNEGYGWSKRMAEFEAAAVHSEFGLRVAIARPFNSYGPRDNFDPAVSHVIPALIGRVFAGEDPVKVWGDGSQTRSFLYVGDLARGLLEVAERYAECDPVNIGTDEEITMRDLVALILELSGSRARPEFDPSRPTGQPRRSCDTSRARSKVGFQARVSLREGLGRTIEWYKRELGKKPHSTHL